jgi:5'-deoxy-5'-methylthioadenosine phosphorylase
LSKIGIIGGSGLGEIKDLDVTHREMVNTPYGAPSCPVVFGRMCDHEIIFIPRHGIGHTIAPHNINYRANMWALKKLEVSHVIAINAVGGITENMSPLKLVLPHQIIDYTHSRKHTYFDEKAKRVTHVDFTRPYDETLREILASISDKANITHEKQAVYGATQGPRLETAAEIHRMENDGCDIVGMTGMPEAALARELELEYASCSVVVNWAAGKGGEQLISMREIEKNIRQGMNSVHDLLEQALPELTSL